MPGPFSHCSLVLPCSTLCAANAPTGQSHNKIKGLRAFSSRQQLAHPRVSPLFPVHDEIKVSVWLRSTVKTGRASARPVLNTLSAFCHNLLTRQPSSQGIRGYATDAGHCGRSLRNRCRHASTRYSAGNAAPDAGLRARRPSTSPGHRWKAAYQGQA